VAYATGLRLKATGTELFRFSNSPITRAGRLKRGRTAIEPFGGYRYGGDKPQGRERLVLPIWVYPVFVAVFTALLAALIAAGWLVCSAEIRARLIPKSEIQKIAEDLITEHRIDRAKAVALNLCGAALQRNDLFEAAKWDRVVTWLNMTMKTKQ